MKCQGTQQSKDHKVPQRKKKSGKSDERVSKKILGGSGERVPEKTGTKKNRKEREGEICQGGEPLADGVNRSWGREERGA